ncbi:flagellar hook protein FlgE [Sphingomonas sp. PAMC 26605]|uniref:flagellar hook protein FlgE n=1 Tax=Sphingomonas sp. PAMC 26605 TaxID=1112214 RepID=UPI0018DEE4D1|nr:flagellar hook protein FlgE [Sphingomonas sp. PAMC 26605]
MNLYSALTAGVSGLNAEATAMAAVSDNISNLNTVGYKGVVTQFSTLVSGSTTRGHYEASGVMAAPQSLISQQGMLQTTNSSTDLGINGAGFFVTRAATDAGSKVAYTRAGSFTPDQDGYLKNAAGYYLQGWPLDAQGGFVNTGSLGALQSVRVSNLVGTAAATTSVALRANLDSTATAYAGTYASGNLASGAVAPNFSQTVEVYDQQGNAHSVTTAFLKTGTNQWAAEVYAVPASDVGAAGGVLASGTLQFNADGSLDRTASTAALFAPVTPGWTNGAGALPITLRLGSNGGLDGVTQFGSASAVISSTVDGGQLNNISSISISKSGVVSAVFDNGTARPVYQLPVATFPNPDGLASLSGNAYELSNASGNVALNTPGVLGAGSISPETLESSTVDLATEFTNMIKFQRAYSASSKIVSTVDQMLQELGALKQ